MLSLCSGSIVPRDIHHSGWRIVRWYSSRYVDGGNRVAPVVPDQFIWINGKATLVDVNTLPTTLVPVAGTAAHEHKPGPVACQRKYFLGACLDE